jgi:hypothetical protein
MVSPPRTFGQEIVIIDGIPVLLPSCWVKQAGGDDMFNYMEMHPAGAIGSPSVRLPVGGATEDRGVVPIWVMIWRGRWKACMVLRVGGGKPGPFRVIQDKV